MDFISSKGVGILIKYRVALMLFVTDAVSKKHILFTALTLVVITAAAYISVGNHDFINFDDDIYVTDNRTIRQGLTLKGVSWAFSFNESGYWHPLTWISHMMDCELYGLSPTGHHWTNLALHLANTVFLYWVLFRMTGSAHRSALVAALFALHPLNVDSVAWVSERKNLLSTFFWMLCLVFYYRYARKPQPIRYLLTIITYTLGLMTKPMLVTLPYVFLLLDYWPLNRLKLGNHHKPALQPSKGLVQPNQPASTAQLIIEKLPFIGISFGSIWLSISSLQHIQNMNSGDTVPLALRISNAIVSYVSYIGKMIWPVNLAIYYPFPTSIPLWQVAGATVVLTVITGLCLYLLHRKPYLTVGWLWYLGSLVPVIGIVQGGLWPQMADRWAYIPLIGLFIIIAWMIPDRLYRWRPGRAILVTAVSVVVGSLFFATQQQVQHWQSSRTLFEHALKVTPPNFITHNNLGNALLGEGESEAALKHFRTAVALEPQNAGAYNNLGNALMKLESVDEAIESYNRSIRLNPTQAKTYNNLAVALNKQDRLTAAIQHLQTALRLEPDYADAYNNLGAIYRKKGQVQNAAKCYLTAIRLKPDFPQPYNNLGLLLRHEKKLAAAIDYFRQALNADPDFAAAKDNLIQARAALDRFERTAARFQKELYRNPDNADLRVELGDLYKAHNRLNDAIKQYQGALAIRPNSVGIQSRLAIVHAMKGQYDDAIDLLKVLVQRHPENANLYYNLAGIYSRNNQLEDSIYWLQMAIAKGFNNWEQIKVDRNFDNLKGTSFFIALIHER